MAKHLPARERSWNYAAILRARSVRDLQGIVRVLSMQSYIGQFISSKELEKLSWSAAQVFVTENFASTLMTRTGITSVNEFIRVCDVVLVFNNGQVLLVSECEADHILELLWSTRGDSAACCFRFRDVRLSLGSCLDEKLPLLSTIACHVYNGKTMLTKNQEAIVKHVFRDLLRNLTQRETTLSNFVKSRGNSHKWTRSFLHELCCRMDLEEVS